MWTRKDWLILAGVTVLAACLRLYQLGETPPGFQFDEAFNAIDAQQVLAGHRPLFLPANGGREVLYTYWQATLGALFGLNVVTLRLASALAGIFAVAATYATLRAMVVQHSRRVAGFTAVVLAVNLWHIQFSHYGIRVIMMPLLLCGVFGFFWRGIHAATPQARRWSYVASGVLVGLTPWTHPTGRFVPLILAFYVLWLWARRPATRGWSRDSLFAGLLLTGGVALLVFLPLGIEFLRHPDFFFGHASEVSVFADRVSSGSPLAQLAHNLLRVAGMFSVAGDLDWTHNLAGRPVFDWLLAIPFYIGLFLWLWRLRRSDDPDFDALSLLGFWALAMLLPTLLSEAAPNYSRTLPALPALFVAAGLGLDKLTTLRRPAIWLGPLLAGLILTVSGGLSVYDYFVRFARDQAVYYAYDADKLDALNALAGYAGENRVYLAQLWGETHATVYYLRGRLGIESVDTTDALVLPPPGMGAVYGFPAEQHRRAEQLATFWPNATLDDLADPYGNHLITVVRVPADALRSWPPALEPTTSQEARFAEAPTLLGMRAEPESADLYLYWRAEQKTLRDLTAFVHLVDKDGRRVGQVDKLPANGSFLTPYWLPGERVIDRYRPEISDGCAGGTEVRVVVGWYQYLADNARMARSDIPGDSAVAGRMTLPPVAYPQERFAPGTLLDAPVAEGLTLVGADLPSGQWEAGAPVTIDLYWRGGPGDGDHRIGLALAGDGGDVPLSAATELLAPATVWPAGDLLCRRVRTQIPPATAPGRYQLLLVADNRAVPLREIEIQSSLRLYDVPAIGVPVTALFDEQIALRRWALEVGTDLKITLVWQALTPPAAPYKVFVHVMDADGQIIAQSDAEPGQNPTSQWAAGEVQVDTHVIPLPAGDAGRPLRLAVGLYDPASGQRLAAVDDSGAAVAGDALLLGEVTRP